QDAETFAAGGFYVAGQCLRGIEESRPGADFAVELHGLGAVRVVQTEDGSLSEGVGRPETRRVIRITFNFGGTAFVAFHEQANRIATEGHGRSVKRRAAEDHAVRLLHVGNNVVFVGTAAAREAGERERRTHELEKFAPINRFIPLRSMTRELAV